MRDVVHEAAHEEDSAAARLQHVLRGERVGDGVWLEASPLIGHSNDERIGAIVGLEGEFDGDTLGDVLAIAVLDGVDHATSRTATPTQWMESSSKPAMAPSRSLIS